MSNNVTKAVEAIYKMDNDELKQVAEAIQMKRQFCLLYTSPSPRDRG